MKILESFTFPKAVSKPGDLRLPQARVLRALLPLDGNGDTPALTRVELAERAGFTIRSGLINRVLQGIREGSSSGNPHKGLLDLKLVAAIESNGIKKYRITPKGINAIKEHPRLPELRDKTICVNYRYLQDLEQDLEEIEGQKGIDLTTKKALVDARRGQGRFRAEVLKSWGNCCSVTYSTIWPVIRASHIKPWRESNNTERLDRNNGLPLIANFDALFDAGLISFDSAGKLLISPELTMTEQKIFGILEKSLRKKPNAKMADYLAYHRLTNGFQ